MTRMRYRLALDLGTTSLGWALVRLDVENSPCAVIKAGVRIFSDGRSPKDGSSLAVTRRDARAMRRRRDRLLRRKARLTRLLIEHGFFSADVAQRKALELLDPYALRAAGLERALAPGEFARALFHINQRRGFKSNRRTDKKDNDSGALKTAIAQLRGDLATSGLITVGAWLHRRRQQGQTVRARYRQTRLSGDDGKARIDKRYDLYIDRAMVEAEFDALWQRQSQWNPALFNETARFALKDALLHQRRLRPVEPGRCTLLPDEKRAPLALPSTQRFRILQEVNHLRLLRPGLLEEALTLEQRDAVVDALERRDKVGFVRIKELLGLSGADKFSIEDAKRTELKGNVTSARLANAKLFGKAWHAFDLATQDDIVARLVADEDEAHLLVWLQDITGVDEARAEAIAGTTLPEGHGSLSVAALRRILPELQRGVVTYSDAVQAAGFEHHSHFGARATGEILDKLPYYGKALQRHVGFGSGKVEDTDEKRYGRIANPTVHIGLNQVRLVVNALIRRYGHPSEVIVELARDLKQSKVQRDEDQRRQADNQKRNARLRAEAAQVLMVSEDRVRIADVHKMILWAELSHDPADRRCPYSGAQISLQMLLSDQVEIEHILPFSETLDDSLANKTVALRGANRIKGNRTPWQAFGVRVVPGYDYAAILERANQMQVNKRYRFGEEGYQRWLKEDSGFLARALNDTRYLSRVAREYLTLVCPQATRVIPGQMTAMLRRTFGLNHVLGLDGEKNRNDHRHHAVDACVVAVTDQGLLQRFARASASARERELGRLVEDMPLPWPSYREHVSRAIANIWVSHKPDHGHEGAMHNDTAYGLMGNGRVRFHKAVDGVRTLVEDNLTVIEIADASAAHRHGTLPDGSPQPYKGYKGDSNYCIEVVRDDKGGWQGEVVSTFSAYQAVRRFGPDRLRDPRRSLSGRSLVMRLMLNDSVRLQIDGQPRTLRVATISGNGQVFMADLHEANVDARNRDKLDPFAYTSKMAGSFKKAQARRATVDEIGTVRDPGFKG
ncbi:MAG: type II CRISPR RNA-guided endonuclease Cas9 [Burkholderiales bacterium]|nr:type II CRISPR RNA-guided endonuclease Cas9 [Burkholderiales bacterium]